MKLCIVSLLAFAALASGATNTNWPQFRGPSANGVGAGAPPTEWNVESGKNIRWKTAIPAWATRARSFGATASSSPAPCRPAASRN